MIKVTSLISTLAICCMFVACTQKQEAPMDKKVIPPKAKKIEKVLTGNGQKRIDNYYWLNERENPEVIAHLEGENAYTETLMKHTEAFQEKLYNEIIGRIKQTDESVPYFMNGYFYYTRYEEGQEYPIYCRKKTQDSEEEVMLNVNVMAEDHDYYQVAGVNVSEDNKLVAFGVDTVSRRQYTIHVKNLETGELLKVAIPNTTSSSTWANDSKTLFYTKNDEQTLRSNRVFKHKLDSNVEDKLIFEEKDDTFYTGITKTKSGKFLVIWSGSTLTNDYRILNADNPDDDFQEFNARESGLEYSIEHFEDKFYIITNLDATNFRLMETPDTKTQRNNWTEVIPHRKEVFLESVEVFKNHLVLEERSKGLTHLRVINQRTKAEHYLDFGEEAYTAYVSGTNVEMDSEVLRYGYTSLTTPNSSFDYDMETKEKTLLKRQEVVGGYDPEEYETKRLFAEARDGVMVPISLVYKKGFKKPAGNPLLLYGYGSYGATIDPTFSSVRLSLLDRGFVFAIAHIRGGQMMGRQWYEDGKLFKKKNTFNDFIDCGEFLIAESYADKDNLFAMGGSAGGLLMGAVVNQRPDLWKGVVASVPFVDVMTTMLDESIPLTTGEYDEWGNPNEFEAFQYMMSYSPYDQVKAQSYPNMLVTTGLHDSQVQYFEPAKWVAKLRELKTDNNVILLETNMDAGHGGASGRFKRYKETALDYAFILDLAEAADKPN